MYSYMVFMVGCTPLYYNLEIEDEKNQALDKLVRTFKKTRASYVYIITESDNYYLYYITTGIEYKNLNKLYNYYDREILAPILMELKLKK